MPGTTPTVETVRWRAERPTSSCSRVHASSTASTFASGSPMPMNTTLRDALRRGVLRAHDLLDDLARGRGGARSRPGPSRRTCIPSRSPACDETHTVARCRIAHQHGLDLRAVGRAPQPLRGRRRRRRLHRVDRSKASGSASASRARSAFGSVVSVVERPALRPEPVVELRERGRRASPSATTISCSRSDRAGGVPGRRHVAATSRSYARSVRCTREAERPVERERAGSLSAAREEHRRYGCPRSCTALEPGDRERPAEPAALRAGSTPIT